MAISGAAVQITLPETCQDFLCSTLWVLGVLPCKNPVSQESLTTHHPLKPPLLCAPPLFAKFQSRAVRIEYQSHLTSPPFISNGKPGN